MSVNYDSVCRLCLSSRGELLPIFPTTSSDDSEPPVLVSKIKDCVSVQINEDDELPTNVCMKCVNNVNNWHIFKAVCERSQNKLQSLKDGSQLEEVQIKSEPLSDEAYDDGVVIDGSYSNTENAGPSSKLQPEGPPILASLGLTPRSDKTCVDPRMDWHRVHTILDVVQDDDIIDSLQNIEECDILHQSDHDSETDSELKPDVDDDYVDCKNGYKCKNNKKLSKAPKVSPNENNEKIKEVLTLRKRKLEQPEKVCLQPKHAWQLMFTDDLLELIVTSTNENIHKIEGSAINGINVNELKTVIGILYYHGIMRPTHPKISDLWHSEFGTFCVRSAMNLDRFKLILQYLSFDNNDDSILQLDIMKRMRQVFEIFALNCRTAHEIGNLAVIDEVIVPVYGPCPFRYNIQKKALKSGMKMVLLVDPTNFYVTNLDIITDPYFGSEDIVNKLVQHLAGMGRTIIMDSWYTSRTLMDKLKDEYQLYSIAALNPKDVLIPPLFLSRHRKPRTFMSGFLDDNIVLTSYVNSENKSINVVTNEPKYYKRGHVQYTTVVSVYKKNQSAVEMVDVLMHYYTTMQHSNDWTHSLFFTLLNIASINAQVIWTSQNTADSLQRRMFIKELAYSLLHTNGLEYKDDGYVRPKKFSLLQELGITKRRRCRICVKTTKKDRRTRFQCGKCRQFICREHSINVCVFCGVE